MNAKTNILVVAVFVLLLISSVNGSCQDDTSDPESGLRSQRVNGDVTVVMPADGKMQRTNQTTYVMEDAAEYSARNFRALEKRISRLEEENRILKEQINNIKDALAIASKK